jgi:hypothetical protein
MSQLYTEKPFTIHEISNMFHFRQQENIQKEHDNQGKCDENGVKLETSQKKVFGFICTSNRCVCIMSTQFKNTAAFVSE